MLDLIEADEFTFGDVQDDGTVEITIVARRKVDDLMRRHFPASAFKSLGYTIDEWDSIRREIRDNRGGTEAAARAALSDANGGVA